MVATVVRRSCRRDSNVSAVIVIIYTVYRTMVWSGQRMTFLTFGDEDLAGGVQSLLAFNLIIRRLWHKRLTNAYIGHH
jgi:hypothetical protein